MDVTMKVCSRCSVGKPATHEFYAKQKKSTDGLQTQCKECNREYYLKNKERILNNRAIERTEKPEVVSLRSKRHYMKVKQNKKPMRFPKDAPPTHRTCITCGVTHENTPEFFRIQHGVTRNLCRVCPLAVNVEKSRHRRREYQRRVRKDPIENLKVSLRKRIYTVIKNNGWTKKSSVSKFIGIEWEGLKQHIESQFQPGMNWDNRSEWHIDHIIPLATANSEEDVLRLNHYTNLRPLWAVDNLKKGAKIESSSNTTN